VFQLIGEFQFDLGFYIEEEYERGGFEMGWVGTRTYETKKEMKREMNKGCFPV